MHETPASQISTNYSFRYNGKALRIYHGDSMEQVTFDSGGSFDWSDEGKGYSLIFKEARIGEPLGDDPNGPHDQWGLFDLGVFDPTTGTQSHDDIEIKA